MRLVGLCGGGLLAWVVGLSGLGAPQQPSEPLPMTTLPVRLVGVAMDADTPAKSTCLIRCLYPEERQSTRLVGIGARACDVVEVAEIRRETVVVRNLLTNRLELLAFPAGTTVAPPGTGRGNEAGTPVPVTAGRNADAPRVVAVSSDVVTIEVRKDVIDHCLANLPELLDSALATPRYRTDAGGQQLIEGFEISRIKEGSIVEQLGLRSGDVILEVNGSKLESVASVIALLGQVQSMTQAKMTVLRGGRRMTFIFNTK